MDISLMGFVRRECACLVSDQCIGIEVVNNSFRKPGKCWVQEKNPCEYFVRVVLPVAHNLGCYDKVMLEYQDIDLAIKKRKPRFCECGIELLKGCQICGKCKKKKRRENYRAQTV